MRGRTLALGAVCASALAVPAAANAAGALYASPASHPFRIVR